MEHTVVKLDDIAKKIGNKPQEITLPNGQTRMTLNWDGPTARAAVLELKEYASKGEPVVIDGAGPAWFAAATSHAVHPSAVALYSPMVKQNEGVVQLPYLNKGEENSEAGLHFTVTEGKEYVRLEMNFIDGKPFDVEQLPNVVVPEIPQRKDLVVGSSNKETSGPIINYVAASIAQTYAHEVPSISFFQPQTQGYTVGITHDATKMIGDLIPETEVEKDIENAIQEKSRKDELDDKIAEAKEIIEENKGNLKSINSSVRDMALEKIRIAQEFLNEHDTEKNVRDNSFER